MSTEVIMKTIALFEKGSPETLNNNQEPNDDPTSAQNLFVLKRLNKGKFPIYQVISKANQRYYAMKVFTDIVQGSDEYYRNELRFTSLNHPNVIKIVGSGKDKTIVQKGLFMNVTYVLSEYAPHGDFLDLMIHHKNEIDDKIVRTYFRQLIEGLEYLHSKGIAHFDIKPENLLLGEDFVLKITDFDLSHSTGDDKIISRGTPRYRAPEFYNSKTASLQLEFPFAADIYSAGIILFILKSGGVYPHSEHQLTDGVDYTALLEKESRKFWSKHSENDGKPKGFYDSKFKKLFSGMVKTNPKKRFTIKKIKESKWYNGPVYSPQELQQKMKDILYY